jgi:hypothetical protein
MGYLPKGVQAFEASKLTGGGSEGGLVVFARRRKMAEEAQSNQPWLRGLGLHV